MHDDVDAFVSLAQPQVSERIHSILVNDAVSETVKKLDAELRAAPGSVGGIVASAADTSGRRVRCGNNKAFHAAEISHGARSRVQRRRQDEHRTWGWTWTLPQRRRRQAGRRGLRCTPASCTCSSVCCRSRVCYRALAMTGSRTMSTSSQPLTEPSRTRGRSSRCRWQPRRVLRRLMRGHSSPRTTSCTRAFGGRRSTEGEAAARASTTLRAPST